MIQNLFFFGEISEASLGDFLLFAFADVVGFSASTSTGSPGGAIFRILLGESVFVINFLKIKHERYFKFSRIKNHSSTFTPIMESVVLGKRLTK
jgi:hypothetical protein